MYYMVGRGRLFYGVELGDCGNIRQAHAAGKRLAWRLVSSFLFLIILSFLRVASGIP